MTDPTDGDEQDHRGDRHEDIIEAGQQPELFLIHLRGMSSRGDIIPKAGCLLRGHRACGDGGLEIAFAVHGLLPSSIWGRNIALVYQCSNTANRRSTGEW